MTDGSGSVITGGLTISSVSSSNSEAIIFLALRLFISIANTKPIANKTRSKITANCIANGCSCNVCGVLFPSIRLVPTGHWVSVMKSSGFWKSSGGNDGAVSASGDIVADGDIIAYNASDRNLKDNIQVIKGSLDKLGGIRGVEFDWNDNSPGWAQERGHDVGVVAQEIQKVLPEIVTERKNGYLGVDYKRIVPLLIESIKELKEEVEELKKKVN